MTPKAIKCLVLLLSVFCFGTNLQAQCNSETVNSSLHIDFDACVSNTTNGTNTDYSEFTAVASNSGVCNNVSLVGGFLYRNNPFDNPHSCTPGVDDTPGMCIPYNTSCVYTPGEDQAVRFDVFVDPTNGPTTLSSISFYELSSPIFQYINGNNGQNNRPLYYAVRVLVNGVEVFSEFDLEATQQWSLETFDFSSNQAFTVSSPTTFNFELTAYCADFIGGAVSVWDLDELTINTSCNSSTIDLDSDIQIAGGQTPTSCNGTTFNFVTGANPPGSECTWYFDWPSTDPSTIFVGANPVYTFPVEGIYTIRKEVVLGDCFEASELTVSAFNNGVIGNGVNGSTDGFDVNVTGCNGALVNLDLVSTAFDQNVGYDVNSWDWTITVNGVAQAATGSTVSLTLNNVDNVTVSLLATSTSGCQNTFVESFNVNDLFPLSSFVVVLEECTDTGFLVSISDNSNTTGFTVESYSWNVLVDGQAIDPGNVPSFTVETISDIISITHVVNFTNGCAGQTNVQSISVQNDLVPNFDIAVVTSQTGGGDDCGEQSLEVNATGGSINGNITSVDWVVTVGGVTYNFTGNPIDLEGIITEAATVTATVNYDNGCSFSVTETFIPENFPGGTGSLDVTFNGNPVIDCPGDATNLLINANPNYVYNWSPTTGLTFTDNVNFSDPVVSVTSPTTYAVTVTDGGCTFEGSVLVVPQNLAIPTIELNGSGPNGNEFCSGVITASVVDPIPGVQYEWSCGSDFSQIIATGTSLSYDAGTFTTKEICVRIAGANPACDIHACVTAVQGGDIDVTFNGNPVIDCNGDLTPLMLNPNPNYTYTWDPTDGLTFTDMVNFSDPIVSVTEITTYNVTITDGECVLETSILVIPEDLAAPDVDQLGFGANEDIYCDGMIELTIIDPIPGVEYEWSCGPDFTDIIGVGTSLSYDAGLDFDVKEICVQIQGANAACDISTCVEVVNGQPDLDYENPLVMCPGDTIQYEIINNNLDDDLVIIFEDDSHIVGFDENGLPIIGVGENEDVFGIPFTVANEFCVLVDTLIVEPGVNEQLDFAWELEECGETTICFEALNIDPDNGMPFWDFGDLSTDADTSNLFTPCYTYPDTGLYTVVLMDFAELCPGLADTMEIEVPVEPTIEITAGDTLVFEEYPVEIMAETNGNPDDIVWCDEDGNPIGNGPTIEVEEGVGACVSAKITDEHGCSDTAKVVLIMDDGPFNDITGIEGPEVVCANDTFNLTLVVENPEDYTYQWGPADCIAEGGNTTMPLVSVGTENKEFAVTVTDIATMMDSIFTFNVNVSNVDVVLECDFEDGVINFGSEGTISVVSPTGATYQWSNGETGSSITVSPTDNTGYSVTVTDENGCTGVASKDVEVRQVQCTEEEVFIPTAFSPNSDGTNDKFQLRSLWVEEITVFIVYDRWGEEVYNGTSNSNEGWDGTFDGLDLAPDVYAFCILGRCINGEEFTRLGNVSLLK